MQGLPCPQTEVGVNIDQGPQPAAVPGTAGGLGVGLIEDASHLGDRAVPRQPYGWSGIVAEPRIDFPEVERRIPEIAFRCSVMDDRPQASEQGFRRDSGA